MTAVGFHVCHLVQDDLGPSYCYGPNGCTHAPPPALAPTPAPEAAATPTAPPRTTVQVEITNSYSDGHTSTFIFEVAAPQDATDLEGWWEEEVFEHTGDGHGTGEGSDLGSGYAATVLAAPDPAMIGEVNEWG